MESSERDEKAKGKYQKAKTGKTTFRPFAF